MISHGPNCLDGLTCAVVAARYFAGRRFEPMFVSNREIDETLQRYDPTHPEEEELWITDISWREPATDLHLDSLIGRGLKSYWVDHHKSAIDRHAAGHYNVGFTGMVLDDSYAASRLLYEFLCDRSVERGESKPGLRALRNLVMMADDVDRWLLRVPRSRELALAVRAMEQSDAYRVLLAIDSNLTFTPEINRALARVTQELQRSLEMAESTRHVAEVRGLDTTVVAAECNDYAGEIADRWKNDFRNAVFAMYDHRSDAISFRRTPACTIDLSRLATTFGGGGHAAAAGCQIATESDDRAAEIARKIADALAAEVKS